MTQTRLMTIARPYAKAAFEFAASVEQLDEWAVFLQNSELVVLNEDVIHFLKSPELTSKKVEEFFFSVLTSLNQHEKNFVKLLVEHKRLLVLPEIVKTFHQLRSDYEKSVDVHVTSGMDLTEDQKTRLTAALEKRLQLQVKLNCEVDANILGGAIIRAGDLVIDGSGRHRLASLLDYIKGSAL